MRRTPLPMLLVALVALAGPAPAEAEWYMTKRKAESRLRQVLKYDVGYYWTAASCRPQGYRKADPGYVYHRWVCNWVAGIGDEEGDDYNCGGQALVIGSRRKGAFYTNNLWSRGACDHGVP